MWPPKRPVGLIARSRFTFAPGRSRAREVRRTVSGMTSAVKAPSDRAVTVRQTPLTAMLSPTAVPSSTFSARIHRELALTARTMPVSSMMPVNMDYFFSG